MKFFRIEDNKLVVEPEVLTVDVFTQIWKRDKTKGKDNALKDFIYIFYMGSFDSPIFFLPEDKRKDEVMKYYIKDDKYKADALVVEGISTLKAVNTTPAMLLLQDSYILVDKLRGYFTSVDFKELDDNGKPIYSAKDAMASLANVGKVLESLNKLKETIHKEISEASRTKGGGTTGEFEDPD